jgi:hypothetical protein
MNTLTRSEGHFLKLHSLAATSITQMEGARKFEFQRFEEIVARTSRTDRQVLTGFVLGLMVGRGLVELEPEFVRECAHGRGQGHAPRSRPIPPRDVVEAHGESQRVLM